MKIYSDKSWTPAGLFSGKQTGGGPSTFMSYLGEYLNHNGFMTTNDPNDEYDLHFVCISGWKNIGKSLRRGIPIILRQDGIVAAPNLTRDWKSIIRPHTTLRELSSENIYISIFCKKSWESLAGVVNKPQHIIYNGARPDSFSPHGAKRSFGVENVLVMNENFRHPKLQGFGFLFEAFDYVLREMPNTLLVISGSMTSQVKLFFENEAGNLNSETQEKVQILGRTPHAELPKVLRAADVFLHLTANSACSHTVPETLSCGVPVICYSGTGPAEFVGENGIILKSEYEGVNHGFERNPNEDPKQLAQAICDVLARKKVYKDKAIQNHHKFSSEITCERYVRVFNNALARETEPSSARLMKLFKYYRYLLEQLVAYRKTRQLRNSKK